MIGGIALPVPKNEGRIVMGELSGILRRHTVNAVYKLTSCGLAGELTLGFKRVQIRFKRGVF